MKLEIIEYESFFTKPLKSKIVRDFSANIAITRAVIPRVQDCQLAVHEPKAPSLAAVEC